MALGVRSAEGGTHPGEACFRFGDGSGRVCAEHAFVSHTFSTPGRYRIEASWPGCDGTCVAEKEVDVQADSGGLFLFASPSPDVPVPFLDIPFPNDLYVDPETGRVRIGNLQSVLPVNHQVLEAAVPELRGFGTSTAVYFPVQGDAPDHRLIGEIASSGMRAGSPVFLMNTDPDSPDFGKRHPIECSYDSERNLLIVRPKSGAPLRPETGYAVVVTTSLWNGQGAFRPQDSLEQILHRPAATDPRIDAVYGDVLARILREPDVPESGVLAAVTPFTTQRTVRDLQTIRRDLQGRPRPQALWTRIFDTPEALDELLGASDRQVHIRALAHGRFLTEIYQTPDEGIFNPYDQRFRYDAEGNPVPQRQEELDFTLVLPAEPPSPGAGFPVVIFLHGISGNRVSMLSLTDTFAEAGFATIAIDAVAHGSRSFWASADTENNQTGAAGPDGFPDRTMFSQISSAEFFAYLLNGPAIRDNFRQTAVDLMQLVRLLRNPNLDLSPFPGAVLDSDCLYMVGDSLGTMFGVLLLSVEPAVRVAALNVAGGGLLTELVGRSPDTVQWVLPFLPLLFGLPQETLLNPLDPLVNLLQSVIDPGDPINAAPYVLRDTLEADGVPIPPGSVLQLMVEGDETVANPSNEALARALGLPLLIPFARSVPGLSVADPPLRGNLDGGKGRATGALVQCSPAVHGRNLQSATGTRIFVPGFPYPPGYDEPFPRLENPVSIRQPYREVQKQIVHFFTTHLETGTAEILSFWTPVLDWDDDGHPDDEELANGTDPLDPGDPPEAARR